jgi:ribosomal protein S18 acetylase RimI-like enzyme
MRVFEAPPDFEREVVLALMRLADDSEKEIREYLHSGRLFLLQEELESDLVGQALVIQHDSSHAEIKSVSITTQRQRHGLGKLLIGAVLLILKDDGISCVTVATSTADIGNIAFYQKLGFRCWKIERDAFNPAKGYAEKLLSNGIELRDKIWFDLLI